MRFLAFLTLLLYVHGRRNKKGGRHQPTALYQPGRHRYPAAYPEPDNDGEISQPLPVLT